LRDIDTRMMSTASRIMSRRSRIEEESLDQREIEEFRLRTSAFLLDRGIR